jgi:hypothetical protein
LPLSYSKIKQAAHVVKKVTGAEARLILGMASALNDGELPAIPVKPVHIYKRGDNEND